MLNEKAMLVFLHGRDTYRSRQKLNEIIEQYKKTHKDGLSLTYLDGENLKFEDFRDIIQQVSMFGEKKLLVLSNVFANRDFKEEFLKKLKNLSKIQDIILFYEDREVSAKDIFFTFLKNKAKMQKFDFLEGEKLKNWIKQEFLKLKTKVRAEVVNKLIEFGGNDLWFLSNEIKKLISYKKEGGEVCVKDVEMLTSPKVETAIFKTIDAISQKDKKRALLFVHRHLGKGDNPLYLLSMINFQFKNLLVIKDLMEKQRPYYFILKTSGLHPFVVKKSYQQAGKFTFSELKKIYRKIFQADLNIKTGRMDSQTALDLLIAGI